MSEEDDKFYDSLLRDSDGYIALREKTNAFLYKVQDLITEQLMANFNVEELRELQSVYGENLVYRISPDISYLLQLPYDGSTVH